MIDTIAAVATAPGVGALATVRVSGPRALEILRALCPGLAAEPPARAATLVEIRDPDTGELLDRALATLFEAPASYTGEDVVELSCHGGRLAPRLVLEACVVLGARLAEPGEFTRRAYLNGKLDLVQAEAVADLIGARSRAFQRAALAQLERGLSARVGELRGAIVRVEAMLAHHLDFPEEDDAPTPVAAIRREAEGLLGRLDELLATAPEGELLREGAVVVLAGAPNVGKSSLYNALIGEERAIVTPEPGTTRDALETVVQLGGYPFRLVDTAGLRESADRVERLGVEVARRRLTDADVVLFCAEAGRAPTEAERAFLGGLRGVPVVWVGTKVDLGTGPPEPGDVPGLAGRVEVSVRSGAGLGALRGLLAGMAFAELRARDDVPVLTRRRQAEAVARARAEVAHFAEALEEGVPAEIAATHLRGAEEALEGLVGVVSTDDVLDAVFKEFCIGK